MILEVAILNVIPNQEMDFESAFAKASPIVASIPGYISHQLQHCLEKQNRYTLLVQWEALEAHTVRLSQFRTISGVEKTPASFL
jgi:heme-degrading monooxygenase HmoA